MEAALSQELSFLIDLIVRTVDCDRIYLFGSHAYGVPHKDSDLDIFVVYSDDTQMSQFEVGSKIWYNILDNMDILSLNIDILTAPSSFFDEISVLPTLERKIKRDGKLLYDRSRIS